MFKPSLANASHKITGNQPLLLDDDRKMWAIQSGTLAIFATRVEGGEPIGDRRYLFSVGAGEALFGAKLWNEKKEITPIPDSRFSIPQYGMLAVAIEETELLEINVFDVAARIVAADKEVIYLLEKWINHLSQIIVATAIYEAPANLLASDLNKEILSPAQTLQAPAKGVIWVRILDGQAAWMGEKRLILDASSPRFPLAALSWIEAIKTVKFIVKNTFDDCEELLEGLQLFHSYFYGSLQKSYQEKIQSEFTQFQQLQQLNAQVTDSALQSLASTFNRKQADFQEGTSSSLLMAAGAVAKELGITIQPPLKSESEGRRDPVEEIALTSGIRTRRVILAGKWWETEHGPLLAFTQDNHPVALLVDRNKGYRYVLFDPELRTRTLIDDAIANTIAPEAYMFYRPLPSVVNKAFEIFQFGVKGYQIDIAKITIVGIIGTLLGMATPQAMAILINHAIPNGDRILLLQIALGLLALAFGQTTLNFSQGLISLRVSNGINHTLQTAIWDRLLRLSPSLIRQFTIGDLLVRIMAINQIYSLVSGATQRTLLNGLFSLLNLGLMFIYSFPLTLVALAITFLAVILTVISSLILLRQERKQEQLAGEIQGLVLQLINGIPKLRVAVAEERAFAAWAKKYSQQNQLNWQIIGISDIVSVFNELLSLASTILIYWFGFASIQSAATGQAGLNLGTFLAFNAAFGTFFGGVTSLSNTLMRIIQIAPLWERAQPILQGKLESDSQQTDPGTLRGKVALDNVVFRYREDGPITVDRVSIHAEPGEFIAIVGPSGSGKSTVFRLLLGFETPIQGKIYYDDRDLAGLNLQAIRRQMGVVLQNGRLMQGSIFDNITGGALVSMDEVWEASRMAGLAKDIEQMPMGMHTVVSEGGSNLSGGQRQRLLIARSLVLKPKILLMDEATSFLDNRTQAIVTENLQKLNATRIVIAHRLSTIRYADRIYVMEAGKVVQVGSFEELIKQPGLFARLVARQIH